MFGQQSLLFTRAAMLDITKTTHDQDVTAVYKKQNESMRCCALEVIFFNILLAKM